jgi:hypothetical protein
VLFVVDDGPSMGEVQEALAYRFPWFREYLEGSDWHVGVVSTDPEAGGRLREVDGHRWIDGEVAEPDALFAEMVTAGTSGPDDAQGLGATQLALGAEADGYNAGFLREGSGLHVIVASDGPDHTTRTTRGEFVVWFTALRDTVSFSSLVALEGPNRGDDYVAVAEAVGGVVRELSDDLDTTFDELGLLASGLDREFALSTRPEPDTLVVSVDLPNGAVLGFGEADYAYDPSRNTVRFSAYIPEAGAEVVVRYLPAER